MENYSEELSYCSTCWQKSRKYLYCHHCEITPTFSSWTSGSDEIDQLIQENQLKPKYDDHNCWRWIDYTELDNIEYLSEGGYGTVYKAVWNHMPEEIKKNYLNDSKMIAMKKLNNSQNLVKDFTNEVNQDPITNEYTIIMQYCNEGDLKNIIKRKDKPLSWRVRLLMLSNITYALKNIHENGYIHCDIHPGNTLKNEYYTYLSDLGLCKPANYEEKSNEIYGIIPYMAPEVLRGKPFTPASDIYSLGMFMWELTSRKAPFDNRSHDAHLILDICKGIRPEIVKGTPEIYVNLMKSCWQNDLSKRPTCEEIYDLISEWYIHNENTEIYKIFKKADEEMENNIELEISTQHPEAYYISRPLNKHINTANLLSRDIREEDLAIEWPDSNSVNINEINDELETNNSNLK
ncbi:hypothetical protein Glove_350g155 [Diversispora epigaea]|uniref:Protein kinase domain-containing protein n=1 Tax=Diversispora epigaea TaxID=1348612 RepID=A0A397HH60_9GLOM|nr:hypothetical protein Glove_350g155 [Diversispora epigaea]